MMLGGAFWAMWVVSHTKIRFFSPAALTAASVLTFYAQALTAGRMGYMTWAVLGIFLSVIRWRKYLLVAPILVPLIIFVLTTVIPGAAERLLQGFSKETVDTSRSIDRRRGSKIIGHQGPYMYTVTAGRMFAWPFVIDKISESPVFGYGRQAMIRTGLHTYLLHTYGESFPHPHNA